MKNALPDPSPSPNYRVPIHAVVLHEWAIARKRDPLLPLNQTLKSSFRPERLASSASCEVEKSASLHRRHPSTSTVAGVPPSQRPPSPRKTSTKPASAPSTGTTARKQREGTRSPVPQKPRRGRHRSVDQDEPGRAPVHKKPRRGRHRPADRDEPGRARMPQSRTKGATVPLIGGRARVHACHKKPRRRRHRSAEGLSGGAAVTPDNCRLLFKSPKTSVKSHVKSQNKLNHSKHGE
jgi:hypothetical protein